MKRLVFLLVLFAFPSVAHAVIADTTRGCSNSSTTSSTTITCTFGTASTSGNIILLGILWFQTGDHTVSCADTKSNTYSSSIARTLGDAADSYHEQFRAENITGGGAAIVITCTFSGSNVEKYVVAREFSGAATSSSLDKTAIGTGNSTAMASPATATTAQADEVLYGCAGQMVQVITITAETNWTLAANPGGQFACQFRVVSATAAYTSTPVQNNSQQYISSIATYKAAAVATPKKKKAQIW